MDYNANSNQAPQLAGVDTEYTPMYTVCSASSICMDVLLASYPSAVVTGQLRVKVGPRAQVVQDVCSDGPVNHLPPYYVT